MATDPESFNTSNVDFSKMSIYKCIYNGLNQCIQQRLENCISLKTKDIKRIVKIAIKSQNFFVWSHFMECLSNSKLEIQMARCINITIAECGKRNYSSPISYISTKLNEKSWRDSIKHKNTFYEMGKWYNDEMKSIFDIIWNGNPNQFELLNVLCGMAANNRIHCFVDYFIKYESMFIKDESNSEDGQEYKHAEISYALHPLIANILEKQKTSTEFFEYLMSRPEVQKFYDLNKKHHVSPLFTKALSSNNILHAKYIMKFVPDFTGMTYYTCAISDVEFIETIDVLDRGNKSYSNILRNSMFCRNVEAFNYFYKKTVHDIQDKKEFIQSMIESTIIRKNVRKKLNEFIKMIV